MAVTIRQGLFCAFQSSRRPVGTVVLRHSCQSCSASVATTAAAHAVGDKAFGSREITIVEESFINDANATETFSNKFTFVVNSTPSSTQTGGGYFVFGGPVNDRA